MTASSSSEHDVAALESTATPAARQPSDIESSLEQCDQVIADAADEDEDCEIFDAECIEAECIEELGEVVVAAEVLDAEPDVDDDRFPALKETANEAPAAETSPAASSELFDWDSYDGWETGDAEIVAETAPAAAPCDEVAATSQDPVRAAEEPTAIAEPVAAQSAEPCEESTTTCEFSTSIREESTISCEDSLTLSADGAMVGEEFVIAVETADAGGGEEVWAAEDTLLDPPNDTQAAGSEPAVEVEVEPRWEDAAIEAGPQADSNLAADIGSAVAEELLVGTAMDQAFEVAVADMPSAEVSFGSQAWCEAESMDTTSADAEQTDTDTILDDEFEVKIDAVAPYGTDEAEAGDLAEDESGLTDDKVIAEIEFAEAPEAEAPEAEAPEAEAPEAEVAETEVAETEVAETEVAETEVAEAEVAVKENVAAGTGGQDDDFEEEQHTTQLSAISIASAAMVAEACQQSGYQYQERPNGLYATVQLPNDRSHTVMVTESVDRDETPILSFLAVCGKAAQRNAIPLLQMNSRLTYCSFAIRSIATRDMFVMVAHYPAAGCNVAMIGRIIAEMAKRGDSVEERLTGGQNMY
ncbi:MAG: hypothetical protein R3E01_06295 [Pirellulaceae bacterium]|nr:hypothetical protein [Planctomycetales bacterium]